MNEQVYKLVGPQLASYAEKCLFLPSEDQLVLECLFRKVGAASDGFINRKDPKLLNLLKSSNISGVFLKQIWDETVLPNSNIPLVAFFAMMRLVSMAQHGVHPSLKNNPSKQLPLPVFAHVNMAVIAQEARMSQMQFQQAQMTHNTGLPPTHPSSSMPFPSYPNPMQMHMPLQSPQNTAGRRSFSMASTPMASTPMATTPMSVNAHAYPPMHTQHHPQQQRSHALNAQGVVSGDAALHPCFQLPISIDEGARSLKAYAQADVDRDGVVGPHELSYFSRAGVPADVSRAIIALSDVDADGALNPAEFVMAMVLHRRCRANNVPAPVTLPSLLWQEASEMVREQRQVIDVHLKGLATPTSGAAAAIAAGKMFPRSHSSQYNNSQAQGEALVLPTQAHTETNSVAAAVAQAGMSNRTMQSSLPAPYRSTPTHSPSLAAMQAPTQHNTAAGMGAGPGAMNALFHTQSSPFLTRTFTPTAPTAFSLDGSTHTHTHVHGQGYPQGQMPTQMQGQGQMLASPSPAYSSPVAYSHTQPRDAFFTPTLATNHDNTTNTNTNTNTNGGAITATSTSTSTPVATHTTLPAPDPDRLLSDPFAGLGSPSTDAAGSGMDMDAVLGRLDTITTSTSTSTSAQAIATSAQSTPTKRSPAMVPSTAPDTVSMANTTTNDNRASPVFAGTSGHSPSLAVLPLPSIAEQDTSVSITSLPRAPAPLIVGSPSVSYASPTQAHAHAQAHGYIHGQAQGQAPFSLLDTSADAALGDDVLNSSTMNSSVINTSMMNSSVDEHALASTLAFPSASGTNANSSAAGAVGVRASANAGAEDAFNGEEVDWSGFPTTVTEPSATASVEDGRLRQGSTTQRSDAGDTVTFDVADAFATAAAPGTGAAAGANAQADTFDAMWGEHLFSNPPETDAKASTNANVATGAGAGASAQEVAKALLPPAVPTRRRGASMAAPTPRVLAVPASFSSPTATAAGGVGVGVGVTASGATPRMGAAPSPVVTSPAVESSDFMGDLFSLGADTGAPSATSTSAVAGTSASASAAAVEAAAAFSMMDMTEDMFVPRTRGASISASNTSTSANTSAASAKTGVKAKTKAMTSDTRALRDKHMLVSAEVVEVSMSASQATQQADAVTGELAEVEAQLHRAEAELAEVKRELADAEARVAHATARRVEVILAMENNQLELESSKLRLEEVSEAATKSEDELQQLETELALLNKQLEVSKAKVSIYEDVKARAEALRKEDETKKIELANVQATTQRQVAELEELQIEVASLEVANAELTEELRQHRVKLDMLTVKRDEMVQKKQALVSNAKSYMDQFRTVSREMNQHLLTLTYLVRQHHTFLSIPAATDTIKRAMMLHKLYSRVIDDTAKALLDIAAAEGIVFTLPVYEDRDELWRQAEEARIKAVTAVERNTWRGEVAEVLAGEVDALPGAIPTVTTTNTNTTTNSATLDSDGNQVSPADSAVADSASVHVSAAAAAHVSTGMPTGMSALSPTVHQYHESNNANTNTSTDITSGLAGTSTTSSNVSIATDEVDGSVTSADNVGTSVTTVASTADVLLEVPSEDAVDNPFADMDAFNSAFDDFAFDETFSATSPSEQSNAVALMPVAIGDDAAFEVTFSPAASPTPSVDTNMSFAASFSGDVNDPIPTGQATNATGVDLGNVEIQAQAEVEVDMEVKQANIGAVEANAAAQEEESADKVETRVTDADSQVQYTDNEKQENPGGDSGNAFFRVMDGAAVLSIASSTDVDADASTVAPNSTATLTDMAPVGAGADTGALGFGKYSFTPVRDNIAEEAEVHATTNTTGTATTGEEINATIHADASNGTLDAPAAVDADIAADDAMWAAFPTDENTSAESADVGASAAAAEVVIAEEEQKVVDDIIDEGVYEGTTPESTATMDTPMAEGFAEDAFADFDAAFGEETTSNKAGIDDDREAEIDAQTETQIESEAQIDGDAAASTMDADVGANVDISTEAAITTETETETDTETIVNADADANANTAVGADVEVEERVAIDVPAATLEAPAATTETDTTADTTPVQADVVGARVDTVDTSAEDIVASEADFDAMFATFDVEDSVETTNADATSENTTMEADGIAEAESTADSAEVDTNAQDGSVAIAAVETEEAAVSCITTEVEPDPETAAEAGDDVQVVTESTTDDADDAALDAVDFGAAAAIGADAAAEANQEEDLVKADGVNNTVENVEAVGNDMFGTFPDDAFPTEGFPTEEFPTDFAEGVDTPTANTMVTESDTGKVSSIEVDSNENVSNSSDVIVNNEVADNDAAFEAFDVDFDDAPMDTITTEPNTNTATCTSTSTVVPASVPAAKEDPFANAVDVDVVAAEADWSGFDF